MMLQIVLTIKDQETPCSNYVFQCVSKDTHIRIAEKNLNSRAPPQPIESKF